MTGHQIRCEVCGAPAGQAHREDCEAALAGRARQSTIGDDIPEWDDLETRQEALRKELTKWWLSKAEEEIVRTIPKSLEYGSADLNVMGSAMLHLIPKERRSQQLGLEMAIAFYALGKVARLFGAYERGELPSEDTWFDLAIYTRMAMRVRETGRWV